ncbi:type III-A CRISPR-associated protein Csm2 [Hydrogenobacter thermophilus]|uniref:type III-A CRISPR-associated protein Csm2 n=1 Tax=Hydrogenobacter thermophilus TaxID=940 RepID=UPI0030F5A45A
MNGRHQQQGRQQQENRPTNELINRLRAPITQLTDRDIFHPEGYARKVVEELELQGVQLRRFYAELKNIQEMMKNKEDVKYRFYKLYALVNYQANRGVIKQKFADLLTKMLDNIERQDFSKQAVDRAVDLLMAMVAYSKKGG